MTEDTKKKIDIILEETVRIYANLGTKTPLDLGTKEAAKERERELIDLTKDIDFNQPAIIKKIYKIIVTYKCVTNDDSTLSNPFSYSINGSQTFTGSLTGSMLGDVEDWDITTLTPSSPISCQSIQIHFDDGGKAGQYGINDMTIEYRIIENKKVS